MLKKIREIVLFICFFLFHKPRRKEERKPKIHIVDLARAMAEFEGYFIPGARAYRNKNPLNLEQSKFTNYYDDDGFCIFDNFYDGWKAGLWDLKMKCKGYTKTGLQSTSTVRNLIYVWSASDREARLRYVCKKLKIPSDYQLKEFDLKEINLTLKKYLDNKKIQVLK